ncbi:MAG: carbohydrate porin [Leptothrix sp. (in: b-proteobacteria)]
MNRFIKLSAVMAAIIAAPAFAGTTVDANAEFDTGYTNKNVGTSQGGRIEINVAGKAEQNGGFVAGKGTVIAAMNGGSTSSGNNSAAIDDAWVQFGTPAVDLKLGRFEAADLYPTPGDVFRKGGLYTTNNLRGRSLLAAGGGNVDDRLHMALTANLAAGVALEVGLVDKKDVSTNGAQGSKGIRPAISFNAGPVAARLGFEAGKTADAGAAEASFSGVGGTLSAGVGAGVTARLNFANGTTKFAAGDKKQTAILLGADVGALTVSFETGNNKQAGVTTKVNGLFGAYSIPLFVKGATIQPALGYGSTQVGSAAKTSVTTVGARIHYDF